MSQEMQEPLEAQKGQEKTLFLGETREYLAVLTTYKLNFCFYFSWFCILHTTGQM